MTKRSSLVRPSILRARQRAAATAVARALPAVTAPRQSYKLRLLRLERIRFYLSVETKLVVKEVFDRAKKRALLLSIHKDFLMRNKRSELPLKLGYFQELVNENHAIVTTSSSEDHYVGVMSFVDTDLLYPGCPVFLCSPTKIKYSCSAENDIILKGLVGHIVGILQDDVDGRYEKLKKGLVPMETFGEIGGLDEQIRELEEVVKLPLTHPHLFQEVGIRPPNVVLLYGKSGTGKTLLAKAVANSASASFFPVAATKLITEELGEGPKSLRKIFTAAEVYSPSIVFIHEIDAINPERYASNSQAQTVVRMTLLELLNQLDDFESKSYESNNVKVILATSKIDSVEPALLRPGRIDGKIELPLPNKSAMRHIFLIHTSKMTFEDDVNLEEIIPKTKYDLSGADIKAICKEAHSLAIEDYRNKVRHSDFMTASDKVISKKKRWKPKGIYM